MGGDRVFVKELPPTAGARHHPALLGKVKQQQKSSRERETIYINS